MTNILIKLFIDNYKDIKDDKVRKKYGELASFVGILSNIILFIIKFIIGIFINSVAIIVDSFNNLSDSISSIITLIGFILGSKPSDEKHPFGHGRIEYISAFVISFITLFIGFQFLKTSFFKILQPEKLVFSYLSIYILVITILIKIWQTLFNRKIGKIINSNSLIASSTDSRNDVIITFTTILSLLFFKFFSINLDGYLGFIVSLFLIYSGFCLARETLSPLLGESIDNEFADKIKMIALSYDNVIGVHDILVHNYGPNKSIASLHAEIPYNINMIEAHETIDTIERQIYEELNIFLTIHIDPVNQEDERVNLIVDIIRETCSKYDKNIDTHDHRIVDFGDTINFIFDLVIPYNFSEKNQNELILNIKKNVLNLDRRYKCIINLERSFINKKN